MMGCMARQARVAPGGKVYHVINRAVARLHIFETDADFAAFETVLRDAMQLHPTRLLAWTIMSNHFHLVIHPEAEGELTRFMRWLTHTHVMRYHKFHGTVSTGPLYQGRFKSFMVQDDLHLPRVLRYVQRNPVRAGLVERAEDWRWGSLHHQIHRTPLSGLITRPPVRMPTMSAWLERVNRPETPSELEAVRKSVLRGTPFGSPQWTQRTVRQYGLAHTQRAPHRPKSATKGRGK
jgi:putative transposase